MNQNWKLNCPAPDSGTIVHGLYNTGPVLADDESSITSQDGHMQIVTDVCAEDFDAYVQKLKALGVRQTFDNQNCLDRFFGFVLDGTVYQADFLGKRRQIRVLEDPLTTPPDVFSYEIQGDRRTVLYQYGLYYDPENKTSDRTMNCGMMYIIRLSDNSLLILDSGHRYQWNQQAFRAFWKFLHEITGTAENEKIHIACWYFTHAHNDHTDGCGCLLERYHDFIDLDRVMMGFTSYQVRSVGYEKETQQMKRIISRYYPNIMQLHVHTGQKLKLADAELEFLFAEEDAVSAEAPEVYPFHDFNCTSSILKVTISGKSALFLGDTNVESEEVISRISAPEIWKADMVQVAHHCFNYLDTLYDWIAAPQALMPNSYYGSHRPENLPKLEGVLKHLKNEQIFYEGSGTSGFTAESDGFHEIFHAPVVGGPYDFSFTDIYPE